jgi:CheY-like chemotaxis protein
MRLQYKILWFEDTDSVFEVTPAPQILELLENLGFIPEINRQTDGDDLYAIMATESLNNYDLIITDLNLGDKNGDQIISELRAGNIITEVLLYSSNTIDIQKVLENHKWIERASYCVGREFLYDKVKSIIELTVKKQQDVSNTRGLFIAETIVLEKKIENILFDYFKVAEGELLAPDKATILEEIRITKLQFNQQHIDTLQQLNAIDLQELIDRGIITSANTLNALQSILKKRDKEVGNNLNAPGLSREVRAELNAKQQGIKSLREELGRFSVEISAIRDTLAHVGVSEDAHGNPILVSRRRNMPAVTLTTEQYVKMRKDLQKHSANLERIIAHLAD